MYCQKCGAPLSEGSVFCRICGTRAGSEPAPQTKAQPIQAAYRADAGHQATERAVRSEKNPLPWLLAGTVLAWAAANAISIIPVRMRMGEMAATAMLCTACCVGVFYLILAIAAFVPWKSSKSNLFVLVSILAGILLGIILFIFGWRIIIVMVRDVEVWLFAGSSVRFCSLALPLVALSMSLGLMLLARGKRAHYFAVKAVGAALYLATLLAGFLWFDLGVAAILPAVLVSEIAAAVLFGVFASIAGRAAKRSSIQAGPRYSQAYNAYRPPSAAPPPSAPPPPPAANRFCRGCGAAIAAGSMFCTVCGNRVPD